MPTYCMRDDGWPKKRCYVMKPPKYFKPHCRHWASGITEDGCGERMWQKEGKDGVAQSLLNESRLTKEEKQP